jgi:N-acetylglucosamine-6-phosphate deacetylase
LQAKDKIEIGADADLVIISPDLKVLQTYIGGKRVFGV